MKKIGRLLLLNWFFWIGPFLTQASDSFDELLRELAVDEPIELESEGEKWIKLLKQVSNQSELLGNNVSIDQARSLVTLLLSRHDQIERLCKPRLKKREKKVCASIKFYIVQLLVCYKWTLVDLKIVKDPYLTLTKALDSLNRLVDVSFVGEEINNKNNPFKIFYARSKVEISKLRDDNQEEIFWVENLLSTIREECENQKNEKPLSSGRDRAHSLASD